MSTGANRATGAFIVVDAATNATAGAGVIIERRATPELYESALHGHVSRNVTRQASKVAAADRARACLSSSR
jgi:sulfate adenylyltransferase subunit 1 (EFTu-like GTPase family)